MSASLRWSASVDLHSRSGVTSDSPNSLPSPRHRGELEPLRGAYNVVYEPLYLPHNLSLRSASAHIVATGDTAT